MSRLPNRSEEDPDPTFQKALEEIRGSRGFVSNAMGSLAHSPDVMRCYGFLGKYLKYETGLSEIERETVILAAGRGTEYEWVHHVPLGLQAGLSQDAINSIEKGQVPRDVTERVRLIAAIAFEMLGDDTLSDATFDLSCSYFSRREITDIMALTAYYHSLGMIARALKVDLEPEDVFERELTWQRQIADSSDPSAGGPRDR